MIKRILALIIICLLAPPVLHAQDGNLQIHFMNVGQGDGALLISPNGATVLFDNGVRNNCDLPISYLDQLGVTTVDYHVASHYHSDHIGCTQQLLGQEFSGQAIDHGGDYDTHTYNSYQMTVGHRRVAAQELRRLVLDEGDNPVVIDFVVSAGIAVAEGTQFNVNNENDLSVVALVRFGNFEATMGGDLSGTRTWSYRDVETPAARLFPQVEVYKVHHHGSRHSSNGAWLTATSPRIGIISAGAGNSHGHPAAAALERLHAHGIRTYWTTIGSGKAKPQPELDTVGGNIIVKVEPDSETFTVTHSGGSIDTYTMWEATAPISDEPAFSWSSRSGLYHYSNCLYVNNISPQNLEEGDTPPEDKTLHIGCPR